MMLLPHIIHFSKIDCIRVTEILDNRSRLLKGLSIPNAAHLLIFIQFLDKLLYHELGIVYGMVSNPKLIAIYRFHMKRKVRLYE